MIDVIIRLIIKLSEGIMKKYILFFNSLALAIVYGFSEPHFDYSNLILVIWGLVTLYLLWIIIENGEHDRFLIWGVFSTGAIVYLLPEILTNNLEILNLILVVIAAIALFVYDLSKYKNAR